jgi:hypothetical protein
MMLIARMASPLFELALVLVRLDHVACIIINADHGIMLPAVTHCISDCVRDSMSIAIP